MKVWITYANESYGEPPTNLGVFRSEIDAATALVNRYRASCGGVCSPNATVQIRDGRLETWGGFETGAWWFHPQWLWMEAHKVK